MFEKYLEHDKKIFEKKFKNFDLINKNNIKSIIYCAFIVIYKFNFITIYSRLYNKEIFIFTYLQTDVL